MQKRDTYQLAQHLTKDQRVGEFESIQAHTKACCEYLNTLVVSGRGYPIC